MSSQSERLTPEQMKERQRQNLTSAYEGKLYTLLTEENWLALLNSQYLQTEQLAELQEQLPLLITEAKMSQLLEQQNALLRQEATVAAKEAEQYRQLLEAKANTISTELGKQVAALQTQVKELEKQAGSMREKCSSALAEQRAQLEQQSRKLLRWSLIPAVTVLLLELLPRLWSLIF